MESYPLMVGSSSSSTQVYSASSLPLPNLADSETYSGYTTPNEGYGLLRIRSISDDRSEMEFSGGSETIHSRFAPGNDDPVKRKGEKKMRSPRYAFQTRSQVDILDDGYRWRKYGQKAVKNNKFPRSYYRCTHQGCKVKKQVQRLTKDDGVIVTTYEGVHSHPIEKPTDNFEHILSQMQIYNSQ